MALMLRNRKQVDEAKLVGVNRAVDPSKLKPGTFQSLANWVPAKRYKIKKKRGVAQLVNEVELLNPVLCGDCLPLEQTLEVVCCYNTDGVQGPVSSNHVGILSHVKADGSFWMTLSTNTGFTVGTYPDDYNTTLGYLVIEPVLPEPDDCSWQIVDPPMSLPDGNSCVITGQLPQGGTCGKSDEKCYGPINPSMTNPILAPGGIGAFVHVYFGEETGVSYILLSDLEDAQTLRNAWCKFDDSFYAIFSNSLDSGNWTLGRWAIPNAGALKTMQQPLHTIIPGWDDASMGGSLTFNRNWISLHATASYLYVLADSETWLDSPTIGMRLYQLNRTDLSYVTHWQIDNSSFARNTWNIHAFSDEIIFLVADNADGISWDIGYFRPDLEIFTVIGNVTQQCTNADSTFKGPGLLFYYSNNYFYLSCSAGDVLKVGPLLCGGVPWESE